MTRLLSLAILIGLSVDSFAYNIPVFRYALERWRSDVYEVIVFFDDLSPQQDAFVTELEKQSSEHDGVCNTVVVRSKIGHDLDPTSADLWKELSLKSSAKVPYVVVRSNAGKGRAIQPWHGSLDEARRTGLVDSPVRKELIRRLRNSHSVVWLMVKSKDEKQNDALRDLLKTQCETLSTKIKLPDGIGLPGSELHSEVPLLVKFSFLEIDPSDPNEGYLTNLFTSIRAETNLEQEPLIVPVFGRGRALEVIPANEVNASLMEDLTLFLSGACSCQVKDRNPGFDLLLATNWDKVLFGENGMLPPPPKTVDDTNRDRAPTLLSIPAGKKK